jgi:hypothetical protein
MQKQIELCFYIYYSKVLSKHIYTKCQDCFSHSFISFIINKIDTVDSIKSILKQNEKLHHIRATFNQTPKGLQIQSHTIENIEDEITKEFGAAYNCKIQKIKKLMTIKTK